MKKNSYPSAFKKLGPDALSMIKGGESIPVPYPCGGSAASSSSGTSSTPTSTGNEPGTLSGNCGGPRGGMDVIVK